MSNDQQQIEGQPLYEAFAEWVFKEGWKIYKHPNIWANELEDTHVLTTTELYAMFAAEHPQNKASQEQPLSVLIRQDVAMVKDKLTTDKADYLERAEAEGISKNEDFEAGFMACIRRMNGILNIREKEIPPTPAPEEGFYCVKPSDIRCHKQCDRCNMVDGLAEPVKGNPEGQKVGYCTECGVPENSHGTSCGWGNAKVSIDNEGVIRTPGHPHDGEHFSECYPVGQPAHVPDIQGDRKRGLKAFDDSMRNTLGALIEPEGNPFSDNDPQGEIPEQIMQWLDSLPFSAANSINYPKTLAIAMYHKRQELIDCMKSEIQGYKNVVGKQNGEIATLTQQRDAARNSEQKLIADLDAKFKEATEYRKALEEIKNKSANCYYDDFEMDKPIVQYSIADAAIARYPSPDTKQ